MSFSELIARTRSYRRFDGAVSVSRETLCEILADARLASSAANLQPLRYLPVTERADADFITAHAKWAAYLTDWSGPREEERPPAWILLLSEKEKKQPLIDVGIAAETILLSATSRGLGGCMFLSFDEDALREHLAIGEEMRIELAVAVGRPCEEVRIVEATDSIRYYREGDAHIVPKRPLRDLLYTPKK